MKDVVRLAEEAARRYRGENLEKPEGTRNFNIYAPNIGTMFNGATSGLEGPHSQDYPGSGQRGR